MGLPSVRSSLAFAALTALALAVAGALWALAPLEFFQRLEQRTVDVRFRNLPAEAQTPSREIVVVEIDEASIALLEPVFGRWPWPREAHAVFLDYMREAGARLVVFDIQFRERDLQNPDLDQFFVEATEEFGRVIHVLAPLTQTTIAELPSELVRDFSIPAAGRFPTFSVLAAPYDGLWQAARALGHVAIALDPDGAMRRHFLMIQHSDRLYPSLALAAALELEGVELSELEVGDREVRAGRLSIPLDDGWRLPIWYNGGTGSYSPRWEAQGQQQQGYDYGHVLYSLQQIQEGEAPVLDPAVFEGKTVLVGLTGEGLHDVFTTPYSGAADESGAGLGKMPGVEINAHVLDSILHGRFLQTPPGWVSVLLMAVLAGGVLAPILWMRLWLAGMFAVTGLAAYLLLAQAAFARQLHLPVVLVVLGWLAALVLGLSYQYLLEGRAKKQVKETFSRFVSRDVYQKLMDDPSSAELGGRRTNVTVLFSDLRGFTSMSEGRQPEEIVSQLNEYFSAMVEIVFACKGTVDKFVGDMIMALFNTPLADPHHADHAVQCAIRMNRELDRLNERWRAEGKPELAQGIGLNSGEMVAGVVGAQTVRSYTVIGDNVNLGARLESLCKQYSAEIIISEFTLALLEQEYPMQELGEVLVKGKSKPVKIFRVFYEEGAESREALETDGVMVQTQK